MFSAARGIWLHRPIAGSKNQLGKTRATGLGIGALALKRKVVTALREALKHDPRGLRVRIKQRRPRSQG